MVIRTPDLLLEQAWEIDPESGALGTRSLGYRLYLPAERIQSIEVVPHVAAPEGLRHD